MKRPIAYIAGFLLVLATGFGCGTDSPPESDCPVGVCIEEEDPGCQTSNDCSIGETCLQNQCVVPPTCNTTEDCVDGTCIEGQCLGERAEPTNNGSNGNNNGTGNTNNGEPEWGLRLCHWEWDEGEDGLFEATQDREYDLEKGLLIGLEHRNRNHEPSNYRETYTYDAQDQRTQTERDIAFDDVIDVRRSFDYEEGRLVEEREDREADGTIESTRRNFYSSDGLLTREEVIWPDDVLHRVREFSYDADGRLTEETTDYDDDGVDSRIRYKYDADGNRIETRYDFQADGTDDKIVKDQYQDGRRVRTEEDEDADGFVDVIETLEYGQYGRVVLRKRETATGELLETRETEYTDTDAGVDVLDRHDRDGDGTVDVRALTSWRYEPSCPL